MANIAIAVLATSFSVQADQTSEMSLVSSNAAVKWEPGPSSLPEGVQVAALAR